MDKDKFSAVMGLISEQVVQLIAQNYKLDELTAANELYNSKTYALLEKEETKVWHFSPLALFNIFDEEKNTGTFNLPEET